MIWNALEMIGDKEIVNKRKLKKTQVLRQWGRFSKGRQLLNYKEIPEENDSTNNYPEAGMLLPSLLTARYPCQKWEPHGGQWGRNSVWVEESCHMYYDKGETFRPGRGVKSQLV